MRSLQKLRALVDSAPVNDLFVTRFFHLVRQVLEATHERKKYVNLALVCDLVVHLRLDRADPVRLLRELSLHFNSAPETASLTEIFADCFRLQKASDQLAAFLVEHDIPMPDPLFSQRVWACTIDELEGARIEAGQLIYREDGTLDRKLLARHIGEHERFTTVGLEMARRATPGGLQAFFVKLELILGHHDHRDGSGRVELLAPPFMFRCGVCRANWFYNPDDRRLICGECGRSYPLPEWAGGGGR